MSESSIDPLSEAIRDLHGCNSVHAESVTVRDVWEGGTVRGGLVEVFDLIDHPTAERAYVWEHETPEGAVRFPAVLHEPPVDSAEAAVRSAIAAMGLR